MYVEIYDPPPKQGGADRSLAATRDESACVNATTRFDTLGKKELGRAAIGPACSLIDFVRILKIRVRGTFARPSRSRDGVAGGLAREYREQAAVGLPIPAPMSIARPNPPPMKLWSMPPPWAAIAGCGTAAWVGMGGDREGRLQHRAAARLARRSDAGGVPGGYRPPAGRAIKASNSLTMNGRTRGQLNRVLRCPSVKFRLRLSRSTRKPRADLDAFGRASVT